MVPSKSTWDDEEDSTPPTSPPVAAVVRRSKFDDEEDDSDVVDSWDAADDSEAEAEKARKAAQLKAKEEAEAAANRKSKAQRIAERQAARKQAEEDEETSSDEEEDETERRQRLRRTEQDADLAHAADLLGEVDLSNRRSAAKPVVTQDPHDPNHAIDLSSLPLFKPSTKDAWNRLGETLVPLITANAKKPHYTLFLPDFMKQLAKDLPSVEIKKLSSVLATFANEKMKEEKAAEKGGKKSKAAKTKTSLVASRGTGHKADITSYDDDGIDEDDFM